MIGVFLFLSLLRLCSYPCVFLSLLLTEKNVPEIQFFIYIFYSAHVEGVGARVRRPVHRPSRGVRLLRHSGMGLSELDDSLYSW